ncbi:MAG: hypothetical protein JST54_00635 [Deltaproteobacteria bacterium]|nr:hypothetical protein [Deltaproteobacteria bacterium]
MTARLPRWLDALLVAALAALASANTLHNQPVLDDGWVIFENPLIKSLANVPRLFREPYNVAGASTVGGLYRPFTSLTYALNHAVGGDNVVGYHLVNAALHVLAALLVLLLAGKLASAALPDHARPIAFVAAVLFAVHPAHVEAVTGMVGRADELAGLFALAALNLVIGAQRWWRLALAFICAALGVLSKESAATVMLLLPLIAWLLPSALPRRQAAFGFAAVAVGVLVYPVLRLAGPGGLSVPATSQWFNGQTHATVFLTMTRALAEYFRVLAWPHPLGVDFFYSQQIPFTHELGGPSVMATLVWLGLIALALGMGKRAPLVSLGILWVFAALATVLNIIPIGTLMAERLLYLPSVGFCLAASAALVRSLPKRALMPALVSVTVLLLALTWQRNAEWHDATTLWEAELQKEPNDVTVNNNLAVEYVARGDYARARERLLVALQTMPSYWRAWVNLGNAQHHLGDDSGALVSFAHARELAPASPSPDMFEGMMQLDRHEILSATIALARAVQKGPMDAQSHAQYGRALMQAGRNSEAVAELTRALELDPDMAWVRALRDQARGTAP